MPRAIGLQRSNKPGPPQPAYLKKKKRKGERTMLSTIKKVALCTIAAAAFALAFSSGAWAQSSFDDEFVIGYFSNANNPAAPDGTLRLVNDGGEGDSSPGGDLCAAIYVFDNNEEMQECCSCKITPNGYLALSVNKNLTNNTITGRTLQRGVIKVISQQPENQYTAGGDTCDPTSTGHTLITLVGIHGWVTHIEKVGVGPAIQVVGVDELVNAFLGYQERADLVEDCAVAIELGSGQGTCSCRDIGR
jgi:hypothetical protein